MIADVPGSDISSFAFEVAERSDPNAWSSLLAPAAMHEDVLERLSRALREIAGEPIYSGRVGSAGDLLSALRTHPDAIVAVSVDDTMGDSEWRRLDLARSKLEHRRPVVLLLSPEMAARMIRQAPNLLSWLGDAAWKMDLESGGMSEEERTRRIHAFEASAKMTSDQLIEMAKRNKLPAGPEFVEWLVLLDQGALLER